MAPVSTTPNEPAPNDASATPPQQPRLSLYQGSSQYKHWRFSPESLTQQRVNLNKAAVEGVKAAIELNAPGSSSDVQFLDADDEHALVKLYVSKVAQLCGFFRFPEEVEATAVTYLKRFYLKNTVMDWHPKNVMLTALFLATKTTNNPIPLETYAGRIPNTAPSDVLDLEFLVAQSLNFEFAVWHAHRALWGIWLDLQTLPDSSIEGISDIYATAMKHVRASRLTDAELIYTPSQIALASLHIASPTVAERWARAKGEEGVLDIVGRIADMVLRDGVGPDVEKVREVDKRLKLCKNPEKVVGSRAYLLRQAEIEAAETEKRMKKANEREARASLEVDPFGGELIGKSSISSNGAVMDVDDD